MRGNLLTGYIRDYSQFPPGWQTHPVKEGSGEPHFSEISNPGGWSQFAYRPTYKSKNQGGDYIEQSLPTGANPVGLNSQGKRVCNDWYFSTRGGRWETERGDIIGQVIQGKTRVATT